MPEELSEQLMARHVEVNTLAEMMGSENQRGTPIPALYNMWYRFVQNPSTVSIESYKRMVDTDETLGSGIEFLISCLTARLGAYQHDDPEVTRFVTRALEEIEGGITQTHKDSLNASWAGFSTGELVWSNKSIGYVLQKIAALPPSSILFEVDRVGSITDDGILQYQKNYNPLGIGQGFGFFSGGGNGFSGRPDPLAKLGDLPFPLRSANTFNYMSIRIPKMKCFHYAWGGPGGYGNPYGRSPLRRAYNWWIQKWAYCQMMGVAFDRKGTPLTVVYADPNATMDQSGKLLSSEKRTRGDMVPGPVAAAQAFKNVHNDSVIVLPGRKGQQFEATTLETSANAQDFINAINLCNQMEMRALLIPSLIFTSGDGAGSYALGQEHAKTFDKLLDSMLDGYRHAFLDQVIRQLLAYNFPKKVWMEKGLGTFAKRELTTDEREKEMNMFATAIDKGIVDTNELADLNKMREAAGFEPRTTQIQKPMPVMGGMFGEQDATGEVQPFGAGEEDDGGEAEGDSGGPLQPRGKPGARPGGFGAGGSAGSNAGPADRE